MMFRFYANENLTSELVDILRQQGYDVLTEMTFCVYIAAELSMTASSSARMMEI